MGCYYVICGNIKIIEKKVIVNHLCYDEISQHYTIWTWLGEVDVDVDDRLDDMICEFGEDYFKRARVYDILCSDKGY